MLVGGVTPLRPEPALFEAMLAGWSRQQRSRRLSVPLVEGRERLVRRFQAFAGAWPWCWTPEQVEEWSVSGGWAHSTIRSYQGALAVFLDYEGYSSLKERSRVKVVLTWCFRLVVAGPGHA